MTKIKTLLLRTKTKRKTENREQIKRSHNEQRHDVNNNNNSNMIYSKITAKGVKKILGQQHQQMHSEYYLSTYSV